ncbi:MAG: hypothetical protein JWM78_1647 [Verrucomicrobiaceae bacterium]|nr:hypothetical protein [Verrucomicrobiaceae bacterium]
MDNNERAQWAHLDLKQAIHHAAKQYPGGVGAIAGAYGYNAHTFQNKLNPTQPSCINVDEFESILQSTRSALILDAIGRLVSCAWVDLGQFDEIGDMAVLDTVNKLVQSVGQLTGDLQKALQDGSVSKRELDRLEQDFAMLTAAGHAVIERAKQFLE